MKLKARLNVSNSCGIHSVLDVVQGPTVIGEVNITCDAWQASNTNGYFAVTGHWIEEETPTQWELKSALLGFTHISNAHNGERLGQALYKVLKCVRIEHKVCRHPSVLLSTDCHGCSTGWLCHMRQCKQQPHDDARNGSPHQECDWGEIPLEKTENQVCRQSILIGLTDIHIQLFSACHQPGNPSAHWNIQQIPSLRPQNSGGPYTW
jgi:hypothetical protein